MITMTTEGQITMSNEVPCRAPLVVRFNYDPNDNPFAVDRGQYGAAMITLVLHDTGHDQPPPRPA